MIRSFKQYDVQLAWKRCWYPIPRIFLGIWASMDCFMLSMEKPGRFSELKRGRVCSVSIDMENQLSDEESPLSAAFCSSYQLPKEDLEDGMVVMMIWDWLCLFVCIE